MVVLKQLGAGPELFHCHVTLTLDIFMNQAVKLVGVGGAGAVQWSTNYLLQCYKYRLQCKSFQRMRHCIHIPLAGIETILDALMLPVLLLPLST